MERLVREELERWDSDSNIDSGAGGGSGSATQRASPGAASAGRARSSNPSQNVSFPSWCSRYPAPSHLAGAGEFSLCLIHLPQSLRNMRHFETDKHCFLMPLNILVMLLR